VADLSLPGSGSAVLRAACQPCLIQTASGGGTASLVSIMSALPVGFSVHPRPDPDTAHVYFDF
jgi:hypothetical protein